MKASDTTFNLPKPSARGHVRKLLRRMLRAKNRQRCTDYERSFQKRFPPKFDEPIARNPRTCPPHSLKIDSWITRSSRFIAGCHNLKHQIRTAFIDRKISQLIEEEKVRTNILAKFSFQSSIRLRSNPWSRRLHRSVLQPIQNTLHIRLPESQSIRSKI